MSEFWRYFRDVLRWPLLHNPGPLSALVQGKAQSLDATRDDIIYFRRQWLPEYCEESLVPNFGKSRAVTRLSFGRSTGGFVESAAQFRKRVINTWNWHMLGGKTEGLPEILRFYGFGALRIENLRDYQPSRWAEFQIGLATPATQAEQETLLEELDALVWLVNEYKAARSVLARIYTDAYSLNPAVWSGLKADHGWSQGLWSRFSGVAYESPDNPAVIVSFGMARRFQSENYNQTGAGLGLEAAAGFLAPYLDRPVWSRAFWSEAFPVNHGFTVGEIASLHWCVLLTESDPWHGAWSSDPWRKSATWDRVLPGWKIRRREWAKVHAVFSWPSDGGEAGDPLCLHHDGAYGDINACYGRPRAVVYEAGRWGDIWGRNPGRRELEILERSQERRAFAPAAINPQAPGLASLSSQCCRTDPLRRRGWKGKWQGRRWLEDVIFLHMSTSYTEAD